MGVADPVERATLQSLIERVPGTAAAGVPLVLNLDVLQGSWPIRMRHDDFNSLYVAERGRGVHIIDSTPYGISRGDVYVMSSGSDHTFADGDGLVLHAIHFGPEIFDTATWAQLSDVPGFESLLAGRAASRRLHLTPSAYTAVASDLAELWAEWRSDARSGAVLVRALFLRLLVRLTRFASGEPPPGLGRHPSRLHNEEIVARTVRTIDVMYAERLRVSELAASAYLSPDRFTEVFASIMGRTPRDYIRYVRIERAKALLATSTLNIFEVARSTGFRDSAYFARSFRSATGRSPREFRSDARR